MKVFEVDHLKKYYGKHRGVEDVNFHIEEGEIFGFIGPNGAGKSTTIRCALSLIFPTSGKITIFGKDAIKDRVEIARQVGYLPSEVAYYENMKVKTLFDYSMSFFGIKNEKRLSELAERLDLDLTRKIEDLSLGNKKKVGIVQGLLHEPKLIVLDEPTSGLDPLMQQTFFDMIQEESNKGATVLFSSHILSEVKRLSDRIALIKDGRIEDMDQVSALKDNHYKIVTVQAEKAVLEELAQRAHMEVRESFAAESKFLYRGDLHTLLRELSQLKLNNLTIEDPSLEEIFLDYYRKDPS